MLVTWEITIDEDDPIKAVKEALRIQRDPNSIATCFTVENDDGETMDIDLGTIVDNVQDY